jgi:hypothetical protein
MNTVKSASETAAQEARDLAQALELSQADAQSKKEADEELDKALQASLALSQEEEDLQRAMDISFLCSAFGAPCDSTGLLSGVPGASVTQSASTVSSTTHEDVCPAGQFMLKACCDGDTRRSRVEWPGGTCLSVVLREIRATVRRIFGTALDGADFALKYYDSDGDACTLVEATLEDAISFVYNGTLYLLVEVVRAPFTELHIDTGVDSLSSLGEAHDLESGAFQMISSEDVRVTAISIATPPSTPREAPESSRASDSGETMDWTMVVDPEADIDAFA